METQQRAILIIDDEPNLRRSLEIVLTKAGYMVMTAGGGEDARQILQECQIDLVFLDLRMPDINGLDLLPEIHRYYQDLPVLILTGHATLETAIEAVRKGARDYLLKPIDPQTIISRVGEIFNEDDHPRRRREIVDGMKTLLGELSRLEGVTSPDSGILASQKSTYPDRYLSRGVMTLDLHTRQVSVGGKNTSLSPTAFEYLVTLLKHSPEVVASEKLVAEAQNYTSSPAESKEIARWRIHELRKALEIDARRPRMIITVRGVGYRLVV
jgi:DNA-binding response OmpR family regulator